MLELSLLGLLSVFTTTFISPFATAATTTAIPLPQNTNYLANATQQIAGAHFSTDPKGQVAAARSRETSTSKTENGITITIIKSPSCTRRGDIITYRIIADNVCPSATITNQFPLGTEYVDAQRTPDLIDADNRILTWFETEGACGTYEYVVRVRVKIIENRVVNGVTVQAANGTALSDHVASDPECKTSPFGEVPPAFSTLPRPTQKLPAIICHPSEENCVESGPKLGVNYDNAKPFIIDFSNETPFSFDQVLYASNNPELGVRFKEAVADIIPGECRVIPDDIVLHPEFQSALSRRADPANFFMLPIYESEQDFKKLVHENEKLGIQHLDRVRDALVALQRKYWLLHLDILRQVFAGQLTGADAKAQISILLDQWKAELVPILATLQTQYNEMQQQRKENFPQILCGQSLATFDPNTCKAEINVKSAIARSCGKDADAGFATKIPEIKSAYETIIDGQASAYTSLQSQVSLLQPVANLWGGQLSASLDAYDGGDDSALRAYDGQIGILEQEALNALYALYQQHAGVDRQGDEGVRIDRWEKTLEGEEGLPFPYDPDKFDAPKKVVVDCSKEKLTNHHVETTWCEVGDYPELLLRGAPEPVKARLNAIFLPDTSDLDGTTTKIEESLVTGQLCNRGPGNPWWADDCSCQCDDLLPSADVGIDICDAPDPENMKRHDYYITSQAECAADAKKHLYPKSPEGSSTPTPPPTGGPSP